MEWKTNIDLYIHKEKNDAVRQKISNRQRNPNWKKEVPHTTYSDLVSMHWDIQPFITLTHMWVIGAKEEIFVLAPGATDFNNLVCIVQGGTEHHGQWVACLVKDRKKRVRARDKPCLPRACPCWLLKWASPTCYHLPTMPSNYACLWINPLLMKMCPKSQSLPWCCTSG